MKYRLEPNDWVRGDPSGVVQYIRHFSTATAIVTLPLIDPFSDNLRAYDTSLYVTLVTTSCQIIVAVESLNHLRDDRARQHAVDAYWRQIQTIDQAWVDRHLLEETL